MSDEKTKKTPAKAKDGLAAKVRHQESKLNKVICRLEELIGFDLDGDSVIGNSESGFSRLGVLIGICILSASVLFGAEVIRQDQSGTAMITYGQDSDGVPNGDMTIAGEFASVGTESKGTVNTLTGLSGVEYVNGNLHSVTLTCATMSLITMDNSAIGVHGGTNVYTYPEGLICNLGAVIDGALTSPGAAWALTNWVGDVALGTVVATTNATPMTTTEQDILQNTDVAAAVQSVGTLDAISIATILTESGARWFDGTTTAKKVWLNVLMDENAANEDYATNTFTGTIEFSYIVIGDN